MILATRGIWSFRDAELDVFLAGMSIVAGTLLYAGVLTYLTITRPRWRSTDAAFANWVACVVLILCGMGVALIWPLSANNTRINDAQLKQAVERRYASEIKVVTGAHNSSSKVEYVTRTNHHCTAKVSKTDFGLVIIPDTVQCAQPSYTGADVPPQTAPKAG